MRASDYQTIYTLIEGGASREAICKAYGMKPHTLYLRLKEDRPDLLEKTKSLPTRLQVDINDVASVNKALEHTGREVKVGIARVTAHEVRVMVNDIDKQEAAVAADPQAELKSVALKDARNLKALIQCAGFVPGMGLQTASAGGTPAVHLHQTLNHATVMRIERGGILADEIPAGALIELPVAPET